LWNIGWPSIDNRVKLGSRAPSIVTGHPGHGKTVLWIQIWFEIVLRYDLVAVIASFETEYRPEMRNILRGLKVGKPIGLASSVELADADDWIDAHYLFVNPKRRPSLASISTDRN